MVGSYQLSATTRFGHHDRHHQAVRAKVDTLIHYAN